jgi:hypothetical protein
MIEKDTHSLTDERETYWYIAGHPIDRKRSARRWMGKLYGHDLCNDPVMKISVHGSKNTLVQFEDNDGWKSMIFTY